MKYLDLERWLPVYREILSDFGYDEEADRQSALLLSTLAGGRSNASLDALKAGKVPAVVTVCGDSDDLADQLCDEHGEGFLFAADGATSTLLRAGILPQVIVSDLDGDVDDQVRANEAGSVMFVHAHGDNMDAVRRHVPGFRGAVVCTCQCAPVQGVFNFGGFTDGDRAACIASSLGARRVRLIGFDFENPAEKPGRAPEVKARKLVWARRILAMLADDGVLVEGL